MEEIMPICPVFNIPVSDVGTTRCVEQSRIYARRIRCSSIGCASPGRLCTSCVEQGAAASNKDLEGCFSKDSRGLCEAHIINGKDWRKEATPLQIPDLPPFVPAKSRKRSAAIGVKSEEKKAMSRKAIDPAIVNAVLAWRDNPPVGESRKDLAEKLGVPLHQVQYIIYAKKRPTSSETEKPLKGIGNEDSWVVMKKRVDGLVGVIESLRKALLTLDDLTLAEKLALANRSLNGDRIKAIRDALATTRGNIDRVEV